MDVPHSHLAARKTAWTAPQTATCILLLNNNPGGRATASSGKSPGPCPSIGSADDVVSAKATASSRSSSAHRSTIAPANGHDHHQPRVRLAAEDGDRDPLARADRERAQHGNDHHHHRQQSHEPHATTAQPSAVTATTTHRQQQHNSVRPPSSATVGNTIRNRPRSVISAPSTSEQPASSQQLSSSASRSHVVTIQINQPPTASQPPTIQQPQQSVAPIAPNHSANYHGRVTVVSFTPKASGVPVPASEMVVQMAPVAASSADNGGAGPPSKASSAYMYYMMASGQCSPTASSDTMDSGTCSDLETTPPPLPKKYTIRSSSAAVNGAMPAAATGPTIIGMTGKTTAASAAFNGGSCGDDSSEGSESSLNYDSLNSSSLGGRTTVPKPPPMPSDDDDEDEVDSYDLRGQAARRRRLLASAALPDSLLRDIRDRSKQLAGDQDDEDDDDEDEEDDHFHSQHPTRTEQTAVAAEAVTIHNAHTSAMLASLRPTGQPASKRIDIFATHLTDADGGYENDRFYTFHINERPPEQPAADESTAARDDQRNDDGDDDEDDCFAGIRQLKHLNGISDPTMVVGGSSGTSTIRSAKGTVRGVRNRVRNGIATFLQMQQTNVKSYKEKDAGKVVLYTTSMGIVRQTYAKCANVKQILRTLLVKFEERDVFMSIDYQQEVRDRMQSEEMLVPQLYVDGIHIGDADQVERLNESGELRQMLKPYKSTASIYTCQACGGYRLLPCPSCKGSKKSVHRNHFTTEFVALKCMNCDEVGLVKCYNC